MPESQGQNLALTVLYVPYSTAVHTVEFEGFVRSDFRTLRDQICTTQRPKVNCVRLVRLDCLVCAIFARQRNKYWYHLTTCLFFFLLFITLEPRVEWYNHLWALNTSLAAGNVRQVFLLFFFITLGLELSDTEVYEPSIWARLETAAHFCEVVVLRSRTVPIAGYSTWYHLPLRKK